MNSEKTNTQALPTTTTISQHNKKCHFRQTVLETPFSVKSDALIPGILHLIPGTTPEKKNKKYSDKFERVWNRCRCWMWPRWDLSLIAESCLGELFAHINPIGRLCIASSRSITLHRQLWFTSFPKRFPTITPHSVNWHFSPCLQTAAFYLPLSTSIFRKKFILFFSHCKVVFIYTGVHSDRR